MGPLFITYFMVSSLTAIMVPYLQVILFNHGFSATTTGVLLSLYECAGIIGPFVIGAWSDRSGRPRLVSAVITSVLIAAMVPVALSSHVALTWLFLPVAGFFWRAVFPVQDAMAIKMLGSNMSRYTYVRATLSAGYIILILLYRVTGWLDATDNGSLLVLLAIGGVLYLVSLAILPKDQAVPKHERTGSRWPLARSVSGEKVFSKTLVSAIIIIAVNRLAMSSINNFFSLYVGDMLGRPDLVGTLSSLAAFSELFFMVWAGYLLNRGVKPMSLIALSSVVLVVRLLLYALVPTLTGAVLGQMLHSVVYGMFHPAVVVFISRNIAPQRRGTGMALYTSIGVGLPNVIGSAIGGVVIDAIGYRGLFASYALFALAALALQWAWRKRLVEPSVAHS